MCVVCFFGQNVSDIVRVLDTSGIGCFCDISGMVSFLDILSILKGR